MKSIVKEDIKRQLLIQMVNMLVRLGMGKKMVEELLNGKMGINMLASGEMVKRQVKVLLLGKMGINLLASGEIIKE